MTMDTKPTRFHIITLGCSKNRVDSDGMDTLLRQRGMSLVIDSGYTDVILVNACGFLRAARDEPVGVISDVLAVRPEGQRVIAAGCMPALRDYSSDIPAGVDHVLTTQEWFKINDVISNLYALQIAPEVPGCEGMLPPFSRAQAGPSAY